MSTLQAAYDEAKAAADAANTAMWADQKDQSLQEEFTRLFRLEGTARRALEAETNVPTMLYEAPSEHILRAEREEDEAEDRDA